jgi:hypothetical protein
MLWAQEVLTCPPLNNNQYDKCPECSKKPQGHSKEKALFAIPVSQARLEAQRG